jgi:hypothetical protein
MDTIYVATQPASIGMTSKDYFEISFWFFNVIILSLTVYVIRKSPSDAVKIGRELNEVQLKDDAKRYLFLTLFSYRGSPVHRQFVDSLNRIDVVFFDVKPVLIAWHNYYDALHQKNVVNQEDNWRILRIELLSQMATSLGYGDLRQMNIEKHYYPEGHEFQNQSDWEFRFDQHQYYKSAKTLNELLVDLYSKGNPFSTPPNDNTIEPPKQ